MHHSVTNDVIKNGQTHL